MLKSCIVVISCGDRNGLTWHPKVLQRSLSASSHVLDISRSETSWNHCRSKFHFRIGNTKIMFELKICTSVYFPILTDPRILLLSGDNKFGTHSGDCRDERNRNTEVVSLIRCIKFSIKCYLVKPWCVFCGNMEKV